MAPDVQMKVIKMEKDLEITQQREQQQRMVIENLRRQNLEIEQRLQQQRMQSQQYISRLEVVKCLIVNKIFSV